jgi:signal transduction histidine kinase
MSSHQPLNTPDDTSTSRLDEKLREPVLEAEPLDLRQLLYDNGHLTSEILLSHIAHEMNQKLGSLRSEIKEVADRSAGEAHRSIRDALARIEDGLESVSRGIRVATSAGAAAKKIALPGPCEAHVEIENTVHAWREFFWRRRCRLTCQFEACVAWVNTSPESLREIISELLLNSVEAEATAISIATDNGAYQGETDRSRSVLHISVEDNGKGIPESIADDVFELGFTSKRNAKGMGLFAARALAQKAGGGVVFVGRSHKEGAAFAVTLPLAECPPRTPK